MWPYLSIPVESDWSSLHAANICSVNWNFIKRRNSLLNKSSMWWLIRWNVNVMKIMLRGSWEILFLSLQGNGFLACYQFLCFLNVTFSAWLTPFSGRKKGWDKNNNIEDKLSTADLETNFPWCCTLRHLESALIYSLSDNN